MHAERLLKLADFLEKNVTDEQFNINFFWDKIPGCGAVGCALGWAGVLFADCEDAVLNEERCAPGNFFLDNEDDFFNITTQESFYLFYGRTVFGQSINRTQEINLIQDFVSRGGMNRQYLK